jgi:inner membrane protein involved in colicin E2 resistance
MLKKVLAIIAIFIGVSIAWLILGSSVDNRTMNQDATLREAVGQLWGSPQRQKAPQVWNRVTTIEEVPVTKNGQTITEKQTQVNDYFWPIDASTIKVDLNLDHRQKGLLWYSTYAVKFNSEYRIVNPTQESREIVMDFHFPNIEAVYDDFQFIVGEQKIDDVSIKNGMVQAIFKLDPGQIQTVRINYASQGLDDWWYDFGDEVNQVKNFSLLMNTDFKDIDFPQNSISPTEKISTDQGWQLKWQYSNLLTGFKIGMSMPQKLNPGPWVANISQFAPISLLLFLFMLTIFTVTSKIDIHPINYLFISAAYFSFHLLLAYLVDHISIHLAFVIASVVSIFLVVSYMRLIVGNKFAYLQIGVSQFIFLVLFSYTFFFKGYTGLSITIMSIITLFIAMQLTARVDWKKVPEKKQLSDEMFNE